MARSRKEIRKLHAVDSSMRETVAENILHSKISIKEVAKAYCLSKSTLSRHLSKFKKDTEPNKKSTMKPK